jgi:hypothetical protein
MPLSCDLQVQQLALAVVPSALSPGSTLHLCTCINWRKQQVDTHHKLPVPCYTYQVLVIAGLGGLLH